MTDDGPTSPDEKETGRLQAISDSVFAFSLTLLGTSLQVPELGVAVSAARLAEEFGRQWASYGAFVLSITTVVFMYPNHHAIFGLIRASDPPFLVANGFLLLLVTVVPLPTDLVTEYIDTPAASMTMAVYAGTFLAVTLASNPLWYAAAHDRRLLNLKTSRLYARTLTRNYLIGLPLYLVAVAVAFWHAYASLTICLALWIFWALTTHGLPRAGGVGESH